MNLIQSFLQEEHAGPRRGRRTMKPTEDLRHAARGYGELLTPHIFKEDRILYPMADTRLRPDQQESLEACFAEVGKNVVGEGRHGEFHRLLKRPGKAYLT
jgi:hemerythrin-like domain-containing protein